MNTTEKAIFNAARREFLPKVQETTDAAFAKAEALAGDTRFADEHKTAEIAALVNTAATEISGRFERVAAALQSRIDELRPLAYVSVTPSGEQVAQLTYTRDAMAGRWQNMSIPQMRQDWQTALDNQDLIVAKVYADFAPAVAKGKPDGQSADFVFAPLVERTSEALLSTEQKAARAELEELTKQLGEFRMAAGKARARLEGAGYDPRSKSVFDGLRRAMGNVAY